MTEPQWKSEATTPFARRRDPRFFHRGPVPDEALARLHYLVSQRRRLGLLLGEPGMGKSFVLDVFARELRRDGTAVAHASLLGVDVRDLLWQVAADLGFNPDADPSSFDLWRQLSDGIAENRYQRLATVLLLDDADEAARDVLPCVARLVESDVSPDARLTVVLAADSRRVGRLGGRLLEAAELRIDMDPWTAEETTQYVKQSLDQSAGQTPEFDEAAISRLYELSAGVPRHVNQLADLAALAGAGQQLAQVDADTIEAVYQELSTIDVVRRTTVE